MLPPDIPLMIDSSNLSPPTAQESGNNNASKGNDSNISSPSGLHRQPCALKVHIYWDPHQLPQP